jgi:hypothetical protein
MDRAKGFLRMLKPRCEILHRLEADAHLRPRPALPVGQRVKPGHRLREMMILSHRAVIPESDPFPKARYWWALDQATAVFSVSLGAPLP